MVLFIYITRLASNEIFNFSVKLIIFIIISIVIIVISYLIIDYIIINPLFKNSNIIEIINNIIIFKNENLLSLNIIYNIPNNIITLILVNYLFLTLIAVVKITNINYGPLRQKF